MPFFRMKLTTLCGFDCGSAGTADGHFLLKYFQGTGEHIHSPFELCDGTAGEAQYQGAGMRMKEREVRQRRDLEAERASPAGYFAIPLPGSHPAEGPHAGVRLRYVQPSRQDDDWRRIARDSCERRSDAFAGRDGQSDLPE